MQPQGDSVWGVINTCIEIALNLYYIYAEHGEGLVINKEDAEELLPKEVVELGIEEGDHLYYEKGKTLDTIYEELPDAEWDWVDEYNNDYGFEP